MEFHGYKLEKTEKGYKYDGYIDLSGCTSLSSIPDNLTFDLSGRTSLTDYPVVYDCGKEKRIIYIKIQTPKLIHIGCFVGTEMEAINAVNKKYGHDSGGYIAKIKECFEIAASKWGNK